MALVSISRILLCLCVQPLSLLGPPEVSVFPVVMRNRQTRSHHADLSSCHAVGPPGCGVLEKEEEGILWHEWLP